MMFWYGGHWVFWQAALMWAGMLVIFGVLIWAVYALISTATRRPPERGGQADGSEARRILDERLARGEIDTAEYQRLRDLIGSGGRQAPAGTENPR